MATKTKKKTPAKTAEKTNEKVPVAEAIIGLALKLGQEQELTLGELIGHMECAKHEVYERITANVKAQVAAAQASDADKPALEVVS